MAVSSEKKAVIKHNGMTIHFDECGHVYKVYNEDGSLKFKPISVTTLIHKYQKPFDLEGMSLKCAQKEGVTQEEIKQRWAKINRTACNYGTKMHKVAENVFNGEFVDDTDFNDEQRIVLGQINKVITAMKSKPYDYESEKIVFDSNLNVAGTIDLIGRNRDTGDYVLCDWKTNKRIRMDNEYGETFLNPLNDIPDCEYSIYGLQLSLYEKILKDGGFVDPSAKFKKFICHFHPETGCKFHEIHDANFSEPLDRMIKDWTAKRQAKKDAYKDIPQI